MIHGQTANGFMQSSSDAYFHVRGDCLVQSAAGVQDKEAREDAEESSRMRRRASLEVNAIGYPGNPINCSITSPLPTEPAGGGEGN